MFFFFSVGTDAHKLDTSFLARACHSQPPFFLCPSRFPNDKALVYKKEFHPLFSSSFDLITFHQPHIETGKHNGAAVSK